MTNKFKILLSHQVILAVIPAALHILLEAGSRPFMQILRIIACLNFMVETGLTRFPFEELHKYNAGSKNPYLKGEMVSSENED